MPYDPKTYLLSKSFQTTRLVGYKLKNKKLQNRNNKLENWCKYLCKELLLIAFHDKLNAPTCHTSRIKFRSFPKPLFLWLIKEIGYYRRNEQGNIEMDTEEVLNFIGIESKIIEQHEPTGCNPPCRHVKEKKVSSPTIIFIYHIPSKMLELLFEIRYIGFDGQEFCFQ